MNGVDSELIRTIARKPPKSGRWALYGAAAVLHIVVSAYIHGEIRSKLLLGALACVPGGVLY